MYPSVFVVNVQRGWYSNFRGAFDFDGVDGFLKNLSKGKGARSKLSDIEVDLLKAAGEKKKLEKDEL